MGHPLSWRCMDGPGPQRWTPQALKRRSSTELRSARDVWGTGAELNRSFLGSLRQGRILRFVRMTEWLLSAGERQAASDCDE